VHSLQVGNELTAGNAGNLGAHTTEVFCLTACFDAVAHLDLLSTRLTLPRHRESLSVYYWNHVVQARQYTEGCLLREAGIPMKNGRQPIALAGDLSCRVREFSRQFPVFAQAAIRKRRWTEQPP
jgi:hypothetical protein